MLARTGGGGFLDMTALDWLGVSDNAFLIAFPALFSIINPIGGALIFDGITRGFVSSERKRVAALVGLYSLLIMFGALWTGAYVLSFFGVSVDALRIAGGIVVATSGWRLLTSDDQRADRKAGADQIAPSDPGGDIQQMAFFPLTLPLTTGPGTIAVAITLGAVRPAYGFGLFAFFVGASLAAAANAAIIWIAYRFSDQVIALIGATARRVVVRLSAFLLMCIGVQILLTAFGDVVPKWRGV
jgi:multiple antibiotic resistance protein